MKIKELIREHKRAIKLCLTILNTLLVILLFSAAALLFYSVSDKTPTIFGCTLFLVKDDATNNATLVFVDKTTSVSPNDSFLYISEDKNGSRICTVSEAAGDMLTFSVTDDTDTTYDISLSMSGSEYGGIVKWHNDFLGRLFDIFSDRKNMPFIYMLIGGICALILLLLILLYFFFQKKEEPENEVSVPDTGEDITPEEMPAVENFENSIQKHISISTQELPPLTAPPPELESLVSGKTPPSKIEQLLPEAEILPHTSEPTPMWATPFSPNSAITDDDIDDVPSIESLMDEINLLGEDWDDDLKIYSSKRKK